MPDFEYTPLTETTALDASSMNVRFAAAAAAINDVTAEATGPNCFSEAHLPSAVVDDIGHKWVLGTGGSHTYTLAGTGSSFRTINDAGTGVESNPLELTLSATHAIANAGPIGGILLMFDANVQRIRDGNTTSGLINADFRLQFYDGSWRTLTHTERTINSRGLSGTDLENQFVSVAIRTLIRTSDVVGSGVSKVRAQVACRDQGTADGTSEVILTQTHLTAFVLRSKRS
tara:strand:+ start:476 stop:1165 length:690 start_codon:yes stop_codon:yes gene_type:complete